MRILLIQAVASLDGAERVFPLGLARLAATVCDRHEVLGLDLNLIPYPWAEVTRVLDRFSPRLVAVSFRNLDPLAGNSVSFVPHLRTLAALVKRHAPESILLIGGPGFTLFADRIMGAIPELDLGIVGEADRAFPLLVERLNAPMSVPGVLWRRQDGSLGATAPACPADLDSLPLPDWGVFAPRRYETLNRYVASMGVETKRGCPNRCRYCLYPKLQGPGIRLRSPVRVVDEMETLESIYQVPLIHFTDPVVNQPPEHLRAICREILKRNLKIGWTGFFREDALSESDVDLYGEAGLVSWYFSADGTSDRALQLLDKRLSPQDILRAARLAAASGVVTVYHFLVNLPGESRRSAEESRLLIESLFDLHAASGNLGAVVINNLRLYPGAPLTEQILREGLIDPRTDLLYPTYFNPPPWDHLRHELTALCMERSVLGFLEGSLRESAPKSEPETSDAHPGA